MIWAIKKIPRGSVKTYSQVAKGIGKPLAVRAVANAIGKNPYRTKIPCHRVIRSDGIAWWLLRQRWHQDKENVAKKRGHNALELLFTAF